MAECDEVVVAGQSMGGAVAIHLAATEPRIRAVAALATPLTVNDRRLRFIPVLKRLRRWHFPDGAIDLADPGAVEELHSYGRRSTRSLHELMRLLALLRRELPMVRQPVLLLHGAGDRTVDPVNLEALARGLVCSAEVETVLLPRSGHAISVDVERDEVNARVLAWFDRHVPVAAAVSPPAARAEGGPSPRR
jgi:carboxylesterase